MIKIHFSPEEIRELRYERFHHPHPLVQQKCEALLLKAVQLPTAKIAEILDITENTVRNYFHEYLAGGYTSLKAIRYQGQPSQLREHRTSIEEEFRLRPPASVAEAAERIAELTGVRRGLTQTRQFLKHLGLRFRKVAPLPGKADAERQEEFKKKSSNRGWPRPGRDGAWCFS